ncbi:MAG TPA: hypothetical protein VG455_05860, partial [Acidimicrobiales bacterium]|nr:hypothetical protein [Acidimicrobiales bacterium]
GNTGSARNNVNVRATGGSGGRGGDGTSVRSNSGGEAENEIDDIEIESNGRSRIGIDLRFNARGGDSIAAGDASGGAGGDVDVNVDPTARTGDSGRANAQSSATNYGVTGNAWSSVTGGPVAISGASGRTGDTGATSSGPVDVGLGLVGLSGVLNSQSGPASSARRRGNDDTSLSLDEVRAGDNRGNRHDGNRHDDDRDGDARSGESGRSGNTGDATAIDNPISVANTGANSSSVSTSGDTGNATNDIDIRATSGDGGRGGDDLEVESDEGGEAENEIDDIDIDDIEIEVEDDEDGAARNNRIDIDLRFNATGGDSIAAGRSNGGAGGDVDVDASPRATSGRSGATTSQSSATNYGVTGNAWSAIVSSPSARSGNSGRTGDTGRAEASPVSIDDALIGGDDVTGGDARSGRSGRSGNTGDATAVSNPISTANTGANASSVSTSGDTGNASNDLDIRATGGDGGRGGDDLEVESDEGGEAENEVDDIDIEDIELEIEGDDVNARNNRIDIDLRFNATGGDSIAAGDFSGGDGGD